MHEVMADNSISSPAAGGSSLRPFRVLILADLAGGVADAPSRTVSSHGCAGLLKEVEPVVQVRVTNRLGVGAPELACTLSFREWADFEPARLVRGHPLLAALGRVRGVLVQATTEELPAAELAARLLGAAGDSELRGAVESSSPPATAAPSRTAGAPAVDSLLGMVDVPAAAAPRTPGSLAEALAAAVAAGSGPAVAQALHAVDQRFTLQLAALADSAPVRELEAAWRGLDLLLHRVAADSPVLIEVQPTSRAEVLDTFYDTHFAREHAGETDPALGMVVLAFAFDRTPRDIEDLQHITRMASSLGIPFLAEVAPEFFGVKQLGLVTTMPDLARKCRGPEYAKWNRLRTEEDALWLNLAFNRPLLRPAWGEPGAEVAGIGWDATAAGPANRPLFGCGAWALAAAVVQGYVAQGLRFPVAGAQGPAVLTGLPTRLTRTGRAEPVVLAVEAAVSDAKALELIESGFAPLVGTAGSDQAYVLSAPSTHAVTRYDTEEATAASFRSATLPNQLFAAVAARTLQKAARSLPRGLTDEEAGTRIHGALLSMLAGGEPAPAPEEVEVEVVPGADGPHLREISVRVRPAFPIYGGPVDLVLGTQALR